MTRPDSGTPKIPAALAARPATPDAACLSHR